jgi:hypothetical protein
VSGSVDWSLDTKMKTLKFLGPPSFDYEKRI